MKVLSTNPEVLGAKLQVVQEFKYLSVIVLDSQLSFKKQVKKAVNVVKFNLASFRFVRNNDLTHLPIYHFQL